MHLIAFKKAGNYRSIIGYLINKTGPSGRNKFMYEERYLITGGSGFIGTQLVKQLLLDQQEVTVLTRDCVKTANHFSHLMAGSGTKNKVSAIDNLESLNPEISFDVVINLAGQGIADKRWTDDVKQQLLDSRINTTEVLYDYLKDVMVKPDVFISGSALGYYGLGKNLQDKDTPIDETGLPDDSFSSQLCLAWEKEAQFIEALGIRTCYLRTGIVLGNNGGAVSKMLPAFKLGMGGPIGNGKQWMSWIHRDDLIGIIRYLIENKKLSGAINGTAPEPVTNKVFSSTLGKILKRPAFIPVPAFVLKLILGQMAEELLLSGLRVTPAKILDSGYEFKFTKLREALADVTGRK